MDNSPRVSLNWLDRAVNWFSPQTGLRRARARAIQEIVLSYEGVRSARRLGGWNTSGSSGNSEIGIAGAKLRDQARDLVRNNAFARRAVREWSKRVVGWGIEPQANTGKRSMDEVLNSLWGKWTQECCSDRRLNFYSIQKLICTTQFVSGECLVRIWDRRPTDGLVVPLQIQVLEPDYLDSSKIGTSGVGGSIINGVQFDALGRIEGYWLFGNHPGDTVLTSLRGNNSKFIPAQFILHHLEIDRPGDARGASRFAAVMNKIRDLDEYCDADLMGKKIQACLAVMVTQPNGDEGPTLGPAAVDANGVKIEKFEPGLVWYGAPGADVKFFAPPQGGDFSATKKSTLKEISSGLEVPYVLMGDDLSDTNYSSYRGGALSFKDAIEEYRWNWLIPQVLDPIWQRFVQKVYLLGEIPEPNYGVEWHPPQFDLLDRAAESEADRLELQIGSSTWDQVVSRHGYDPKDQIKQIKDRRPELEAAGVSFAKSTSDSGNQGGQNANSNE